LFAFPPVLEETALGAAVGIGVAVVVLPPEPGRWHLRWPASNRSGQPGGHPRRRAEPAPAPGRQL